MHKKRLSFERKPEFFVHILSFRTNIWVFSFSSPSIKIKAARTLSLGMSRASSYSKRWSLWVWCIVLSLRNRDTHSDFVQAAKRAQIYPQVQSHNVSYHQVCLSCTWDSSSKGSFLLANQTISLKVSNKFLRNRFNDFLASS